MQRRLLSVKDYNDSWNENPKKVIQNLKQTKFKLLHKLIWNQIIN